MTLCYSSVGRVLTYFYITLNHCSNQPYHPMCHLCMSLLVNSSTLIPCWVPAAAVRLNSSSTVYDVTLSWSQGWGDYQAAHWSNCWTFMKKMCLECNLLILLQSSQPNISKCCNNTKLYNTIITIIRLKTWNNNLHNLFYDKPMMHLQR